MLGKLSIFSKSLNLPYRIGTTTSGDKTNSNMTVVEQFNPTLDSDQLFEPASYKPSNVDALAISNSFIENMVINSDVAITHSEYVNFPQFVDRYGDSNDKLIISVLEDGSIVVYSANSGKILLTENFETFDSGSIQGITVDTLEDMVTATITFWNSQGQVYLVDIVLQELPRDENESEAVQKTTKPRNDVLFKPTKLHTPTQPGSNGPIFNIWDILISSNSSEYSQYIADGTSNGLKIIHMTYFGNSKSGVFIFTDSFGYFTFLRKDSKYEKAYDHINEHTIGFHKRVYSGVDSIQLVKNQHYLQLFSDGSKIGFLRSYDGQVADKYCELEGHTITSIDFDLEHTGQFYAGTTSGDIIVFNIQSKTGIECKTIGTIHSQTSDQLELHALKQYLMAYNNINGNFWVYNLTQAYISSNSGYEDLTPVLYTPNYGES